MDSLNIIGLLIGDNALQNAISPKDGEIIVCYHKGAKIDNHSTPFCEYEYRAYTKCWHIIRWKELP